jgi:hypothetical protein
MELVIWVSFFFPSELFSNLLDMRYEHLRILLCDHVSPQGVCFDLKALFSCAFCVHQYHMIPTGIPV